MEEKAPAPAVSAFEPMLMAPKLPPIDPAARAPTEVSDEPVTPEPSDDASNTFVPLMVNDLLVAMSIPPESERPPPKDEVADPVMERTFAESPPENVDVEFIPVTLRKPRSDEVPVTFP